MNTAVPPRAVVNLEVLEDREAIGDVHAGRAPVHIEAGAGAGSAPMTLAGRHRHPEEVVGVGDGALQEQGATDGTFVVEIAAARSSTSRASILMQ